MSLLGNSVGWRAKRLAETFRSAFCCTGALRGERHACVKTHSSAGNITIFFVFLMVVFLGVAMVTMNLFRVFLAQAHLQISVDNAVYSGAVMQARGLNEIARINAAINHELNRSANAVGRGIFSSYNAGRNAAYQARSQFITYNNNQRSRQNAINRQQPVMAIHVARDIADRNQYGLLPVEFTDYSHGRARLTDMAERNGDARNFSFRYYYWVWVRVGSGESARWVHIRRIGRDSGPYVRASMQAKVTSDHTYFTAQLRQPSYPFPFTLGGLSPESFENLRVYATAMPFGGYLWDGRSAHAGYDVKLVQTGAMRPRPRIPDAWGYEW